MNCSYSTKEYGEVNANARSMSAAKSADRRSRVESAFPDGSVDLHTTHSAGSAMIAALYFVDVARPAVTAAMIRSGLLPDSERRTMKRNDTRTRHVAVMSVTPKCESR